MKKDKQSSELNRRNFLADRVGICSFCNGSSSKSFKSIWST